MARVLFFSRNYTTHDHRFLSGLAASRYETYFLQLEPGDRQVDDRSLPTGIRRITWSGDSQQFSISRAPALFNELRRLIKEIRPDLIHAGPVHSCALLAALTGFKPLISMSWGYDLLQDADRDWFWRQATRFTLQRSTRLITDCQTVSEKAMGLGMPANRIVSFPWGVDLEQFSPGDYPPGEEEKFTLLATRSWEPIYGVEVLANAFVKAAKTNQRLRLMMLGAGSQASLLREIFERGDVMERVFFPGQVSQDKLSRYYRLADLYLSASHIDGSSVSLMEALACGRPVLVSDIPGNREWVEPGVNGWLFKDGDADDLAEKIGIAATQQDTLREMSIAARQTAEQRADWERNFPLLLDAYHSVLAE